MEYENYRVPREEKLEDLVRQFDLTEKELLALNPQIKIFKNFWNTVTYVEVNQIIRVPVREKKVLKTKMTFLVEEDGFDVDFQKIYDQQKQEEKQACPIHFIWEENHCYKVDISTSLYLLGKSLGENKTSSLWKVGLEKDNVMQIEVLKKENIKIDGQLKPLIEIVDKINKTTENLRLKLNEKRSFEKVLEMDVVLKKWEDIKFNTLKYHELEDDYFKQIVKAYDQEFESLSNSISLNILYQIFLYPQALVKYPMRGSKLIGDSIRTVSQLFPSQFIDYDLFYSSKKEDNVIVVNCISSAPEKWDNTTIKKQYEKNYANLIEEKFDFKFKLESRYTYNEDQSLRTIKAYVKEQANKDLFYISEYSISRINNNPEPEKP